MRYIWPNISKITKQHFNKTAIIWTEISRETLNQMQSGRMTDCTKRLHQQKRYSVRDVMYNINVELNRIRTWNKHGMRTMLCKFYKRMTVVVHGKIVDFKNRINCYFSHIGVFALSANYNIAMYLFINKQISCQLQYVFVLTWISDDTRNSTFINNNMAKS